MNLLLLIVCYLVPSLNGQRYWNKNEFKYLIEPGHVDCFYQHVEQDEVFHSSLQVLKGNDVNFYIVDPHHSVVYNMHQKEAASHQIEKSVPGDYQICIDNQYSLMTKKLVFLYILTFHSENMLEKMRQSLDRIYLHMIEAYTHQALSRFKQSRDEYVLEANNSLVVHWSLFQSFLIIMCGIFQVYFIKRLFQVTSGGKKLLR